MIIAFNMDLLNGIVFKKVILIGMIQIGDPTTFETYFENIAVCIKTYI